MDLSVKVILNRETKIIKSTPTFSAVTCSGVRSQVHGPVEQWKDGRREGNAGVIMIKVSPKRTSQPYLKLSTPNKNIFHFCTYND